MSGASKPWESGQGPSSLEPFYSLPALGAVALFALNNWVLKQRFPGWVTGKLSDVLVCFFLPLYIAALLRWCSGLGASVRIKAGLALTAALLVAVKSSWLASDLLNAIVQPLSARLGLHTRPNLADASDLIALPVLWLAFAFFASRSSRTSHVDQTA